MDLAAAIRAAAPGARQDAIAALEALAPESPPALATALRAAHLIGQCAHESVGFRRVEESLRYKTPERLMQVWPNRFPSAAHAAGYVRAPEALADLVYGRRMGNTEKGDGWRYRGRGWLMLTGRANYRRMGEALGVDLEGEPERAAEPLVAWRVAMHYLATSRRAGRTALEWADRHDVEAVTRIVNGGTHGLEDRRRKTNAALEALGAALGRGSRGPRVAALQGALARHGANPGPADGIFGRRTEAAVTAFQVARGLIPDGVADPATLAALGL